MAAGAAPRQDRELVDRFDVRHRPRGQRVSALVVGGHLLLVLGDDPALPGRTADHPVHRLLEGVVGDDRVVLAGRQQRRLVDHVRQVGAGHAHGALGQCLDVGVLGERLALRVDLEDLHPALEVGGLHRDLPVEPAGPQQRGVEDVRAVGRRDQDDPATRVEPVHLDEQLVEGLLPFVVAAAHTGAALPADGVDLVDEHDAGCVLLGLLEQVAHAGGTDTDEHLDEVGTRDRVEGHARLTGDGTGEQRLPGAGRAVEQHTLRDLRPQRLVPRRSLQEVLDLVQFLDGLVGPGHVGERRGRHVLVQLLGLGLAEVQDPVAATLGVVHHPDEQPDQQQQRDHVDQQLGEERVLGDRRVELDVVLPGPRVQQPVVELGGRPGGELRDDLGGLLAVDRDRVLEMQLELLFAILQGGLGDVARVDLLDGLRGGDLGVATIAVGERADAEIEQQGHRYPQQWVLEQALAVHSIRPWWPRPSLARR